MLLFPDISEHRNKYFYLVSLLLWQYSYLQKFSEGLTSFSTEYIQTNLLFNKNFTLNSVFENLLDLTPLWYDHNQEPKHSFLMELVSIKPPMKLAEYLPCPFLQSSGIRGRKEDMFFVGTFVGTEVLKVPGIYLNSDSLLMKVCKQNCLR